METRKLMYIGMILVVLGMLTVSWNLIQDGGSFLAYTGLGLSALAVVLVVWALFRH